MAPSFFLKRFGISVASFVLDDTVEIKPVIDPPKTKKQPKISPFGFEVLATSENLQSLSGQRVFVTIDGDSDDPSSDWINIIIDDEGDPTIDVLIDDDTWLDKKMYFKCNGELTEIPRITKTVDSDRDVVIDITGFMKLQIKLSSLLHLLEVPENVSSIWYHYKFHCDAMGKIRFRNGSSWVDMPFPIDTSMVEGFYSFL